MRYSKDKKVFEWQQWTDEMVHQSVVRQVWFQGRNHLQGMTPRGIEITEGLVSISAPG
jgi:hypothetical protein